MNTEERRNGGDQNQDPAAPRSSVPPFLRVNQKVLALLARIRWSFGSGPAVAAVFGQGLAVVSLIAWLSLGAQVQVLIGSRGLLPAADFIEAARGQSGVSLLDLPTLAWWLHSDGALAAG